MLVLICGELLWDYKYPVLVKLAPVVSKPTRRPHCGAQVPSLQLAAAPSLTRRAPPVLPSPALRTECVPHAPSPSPACYRGLQSARQVEVNKKYTI